MSLKYAMFKTPVPHDREDPEEEHPRFISRGKKDIQSFCEIISQRSSFSSADVKGMLDNFAYCLANVLAEGYTIELDEIGTFRPTLRKKVSENQKGEKTVHVFPDKVSFRCSPILVNRLKGIHLEKMERPERKKLQPSQRKENILHYVQELLSVDAQTVRRFNNTSKKETLADLNELIAEGKLLRIGKTRQTMYILPYPEKKGAIPDPQSST